MKNYPNIRPPMFGDAVGDWHWWFAWRPVLTYDERIVWLRIVWRRRIQSKDFIDGPMFSWWQVTL